MAKKISALLSLVLIATLFVPQTSFGGFHFGVISGVKRKATELREKVKEATKNNPPEITSLAASHSTVFLNERSTLTCTARDPDGDTLTYSWSATGGTISGSGQGATWTAPNSIGTYTITCTVSDGRGGTAQRSVSINVSEWASVSGGGSHTLAIKKDGTLWAWGHNEEGQLGLGDTRDRYTPTRVP